MPQSEVFGNAYRQESTAMLLNPTEKKSLLLSVDLLMDYCYACTCYGGATEINVVNDMLV